MDITNRQTERPSPLFSLKRADELIGAAALVAILGSILWGVISRYLFPQPAAWTYEIALITFAYLVFFGAVAGVRLRAHAAIDIFVATLPPSLQRAVVWFNYILLALFFVIMAVLFGVQAWTARHVHTIALDLSRSVIYAPIAIAAFAMLVQHLIVERPWASEANHHTDSLI